MTTYREAIYMCLDLLKGMSDDFTYTEDHIAYLLDKARAFLLNQLYGKDPKKHVPYSNYQTLEIKISNLTVNENSYYKSDSEIPYLLHIGIPRVTFEDYYDINFEFTSRERLPFVGNNKYLKRIWYGAIDHDNKFCIKPSSTRVIIDDEPLIINLTAIFENPKEIIGDDYMDKPIPIEETLVQQLVTTVVTMIASSVYRPTDDNNDNRDDNAALATFLKLNTKSALAKQLSND